MNIIRKEYSRIYSNIRYTLVSHDLEMAQTSEYGYIDLVPMIIRLPILPATTFNYLTDPV